MNNELTVPKSALQSLSMINVSKNFAVLDKAIDELSLAGMGGNIELSVRQGLAANAIRETFDSPQIKEMILKLSNTEVGFLTDRSEELIFKHNKAFKLGKKAYELKPYRWEVIRDACVMAALKGARLVGNEFNIISGRFYAAKAFSFRKITEFPSLTDFRANFSQPDFRTTGFALFMASGTWKINGVLQSIGVGELDHEKCFISVAYSPKFGTPEQALGKAENKLYLRVLKILGCPISGESDIDGQPIYSQSEDFKNDRNSEQLPLKRDNEPVDGKFELSREEKSGLESYIKSSQKVSPTMEMFRFSEKVLPDFSKRYGEDFVMLWADLVAEAVQQKDDNRSRFTEIALINAAESTPYLWLLRAIFWDKDCSKFEDKAAKCNDVNTFMVLKDDVESLFEDEGCKPIKEDYISKLTNIKHDPLYRKVVKQLSRENKLFSHHGDQNKAKEIYDLILKTKDENDRLNNEAGDDI